MGAEPQLSEKFVYDFDERATADARCSAARGSAWPR